MSTPLINKPIMQICTSNSRDKHIGITCLVLAVVLALVGKFSSFASAHSVHLYYASGLLVFIGACFMYRSRTETCVTVPQNN